MYSVPTDSLSTSSCSGPRMLPACGFPGAGPVGSEETGVWILRCLLSLCVSLSLGPRQRPQPLPSALPGFCPFRPSEHMLSHRGHSGALHHSLPVSLKSAHILVHPPFIKLFSVTQSDASSVSCWDHNQNAHCLLFILPFRTETPWGQKICMLPPLLWLLENICWINEWIFILSVLRYSYSYYTYILISVTNLIHTYSYYTYILSY